MANVAGVIDVIQKIKSADIAVHEHRCVAVRNKNAGCMRCAQACTSGAISIVDNELCIDPDKCIGCGTCATMCPTCALEAKKPNDQELLAAARKAAAVNDGVAVLACAKFVQAAGKQLDGEKVVGVECLGRVDESLITSLAVDGVERVVLVKAQCEECPQAVGLNTTQAVVETANALMDVWGSPCRAEITDRFPASVRAVQAKGYDEGRRNFFFRAKDEAKLAAGIAADAAVKDALHVQEPKQPKYLKVMADGTLPHFIPDRRERLLDSLAAMGDPRDELIETRLWGHVMIDTDLCSSCRMCAAFCPTGAIVKFDEEDGTMGVDHFPGDCVKCRCCEDICMKQALTISDEVFAVDLLSGAVERIEMNPPAIRHDDQKKVMKTFRNLLKCDQVYER